MRHDEPASTMHLIRPLLLLIALLVLLCFAELASADSARVHEIAGAAGPGVTLGQVAELTGEYAETLADLEVGEFAADAGEASITIDAIESALREHGVSMGRLDLVGYGTCRVVRVDGPPAEPDEPEHDPGVVANPDGPVTVHTPATVREEIMRQVSAGLELERGVLEFSFRDNDARLLQRSVVAGRFRVEPAFEIGLGSVSFRVYEYAGTQRRGEFTVRVRVQQRVLAVVAVEPIQRSTIIGRHQVRVREVLIDGGEGFVVDDTALVVGQVAARSLEPGDTVTAGAVQAPLAVRRRAIVDVTYLSNGVRINFAAKALEEGSVGDTIEIEHDTTREQFSAVIIGTNQVRVGVTEDDE
ncbi:MAG: flagellar basal body P-ring formation chaperone FlgA [Phycisphaerales bacterium JB063]